MRHLRPWGVRTWIARSLGGRLPARAAGRGRLACQRMGTFVIRAFGGSNKVRLPRRTNASWIAAAITCGALTVIAGCSGAGADITATTPVTSPSSAPTAAHGPSANPATNVPPTTTPTETAPETAQTKGEHSTSAEYSVSKADIQKFLDMPDQEFKSLKVEDRVLVSMYAISMADNNGNGSTLADVANDWYNGSKDPADKLPATISENNTPIDALHIAGYLNRIAYTVTTSDGVTWDEQLANKDLLGATVTASTNASTLLNDAQKVAQSNNGMAVSAYGYGGESGLKNISSIISSQSITDPEGHKAYKINYYDTVTKAPADITVSWVVASNGQGIWVDYNQ